MRLLDVKTLSLKEFTGNVPPYAILSHTWHEGEEVILQELGIPEARLKSGFKKIECACEQAAKDGLSWVWIDTCCIDKSSSHELSEAINSMFRWYKDSKICYVYLEDVAPDGSNLKDARWFTRGWTLQELIAPGSVILYSRDWEYLRTKSEFAWSLEKITGIDRKVLLDASRIREVSVARRMFWASKRTTTRAEDQAYCLLGIFNAKMPLLYGEGDQAFIRLQEKIMEESIDQSIFAWSPTSTSDNSGCFAGSPKGFSLAADMEPVSFKVEPYHMTNKGLSIRLPLLAKAWEPSDTWQSWIAAMRQITTLVSTV